MNSISVMSVIAGAMVEGTVLVIPGMAQASLAQCSGNNTCLWGNNDFDFYLTGKGENLGYSNLTSAQNDRMDSWANRSVSFSSCGRSNANGSGDGQTFARNSNDSNVNTFDSDEVSSYKTNGAC